ncbi:hypothetical protein ACWDO0_30395 [Nocardia rhamnosiphila]
MPGVYAAFVVEQDGGVVETEVVDSEFECCFAAECYGAYWRMLLAEWGPRRLADPTPTEILQLMNRYKAGAVVRSNWRGGSAATRNLLHGCSRETLQKNLPETRDLWPEYQMWLPANEERKTGITSDKKSTYETGELSMKSKTRGKEDTRLDLVLLNQGERVTAHINEMRVIKPELSADSGVDVSDHFAIKATFEMATVTHKPTRKVRKTSAWLKYLHALELTDGGIINVEAPWLSKQNADEVDVSARIYKGAHPNLLPVPARIPDSGVLPDGGISPFGGIPGTDTRRKAKVEYNPITMSMGERQEYSFKPDKTLVFDGADDIHMEITLNEIDTTEETESVVLPNRR